MNRTSRSASLALWLSALCLAAGCTRPSTPQETAPARPVAETTEAAQATPAAPPQASPSEPAQAAARVGQPAPDFTLTDLDGKTHSLSQYRGQIVVLEWFNPDCPFVRASHTKGSLKDLAMRQDKKKIVWLAINSAAAGKQGHEPETNRTRLKDFGLSHPLLLDPQGQAGHAYGAKHTPEMYIINAQGVLVYHGAIDNSPDGEGQSPTGGKLINYVQTALEELQAGRPITTPESQAYGCSVKYSS